MNNLTPSPSRKYVAMCHKTNFSGYYFRKFTLPITWINTLEAASWYFMNRLDLSASLECVMTFEDYLSINNCEGEDDYTSQ